MNTCIVTVTYGDRWDYLQQLISYAIANSQISNTVVVTNGISKTYKNKIQQLSDSNDKIIVLNFEKNEGSAKAFKAGIELAIKNGADYLWLLDDDNLPRASALSHLMQSWKNLEMSEEDDALLSFRPDRKKYKDAIDNDNPYQMLGVRNSFLGFHIIDKFRKEDQSKEDKMNGPVAVAPYGGMFFHKHLIKSIGLPNEKFFLYADDHDFSYRITQNGGRIMLVTSSIVDDLEKSFHLKKKKKFTTRYANTSSYNAIYYGTRNNIIFEQNFVDKRWMYLLNKYVYTLLLFFLLLLNGELHKFKIILKAIKDSQNIDFKNN